MNPKLVTALRLVGCLPAGLLGAIVALVVAHWGITFAYSFGFTSTIFGNDEGGLNSMGELSRGIISNVAAGICLMKATSHVAPEGRSWPLVAAMVLGMTLAATSVVTFAVRQEWIGLTNALFFAMAVWSGFKEERKSIR